ncbi:MAG TPA: CPBP family intramembrane glutamic endopeptidase [Polyangia bacterium]
MSSERTGIGAWVKRYPLLSYYALAFALSWGAMLLVIGGPRAIPGDRTQIERLMPVAVVALLLGPSIAGLLLTGVLCGRAGLRELGSRLVRWRVAARWYAVALLTAPVATLAILLALSLLSPVFLPRIVTSSDRASLVRLAAGTVLFGGLLEEIGWTGFVTPRLRRRHGLWGAGLMAGILWAAWHFPINLWWSGGNAGELRLSLFVPLYLLGGVGQLTAYRVLMTWVYDRTESVLLATLMHGSLIASTAVPILVPPTTGGAFLAWFMASAAAFWAVVAIARRVSR